MTGVGFICLSKNFTIRIMGWDIAFTHQCNYRCVSTLAMLRHTLQLILHMLVDLLVQINWNKLQFFFTLSLIFMFLCRKAILHLFIFAVHVDGNGYFIIICQSDDAAITSAKIAWALFWSVRLWFKLLVSCDPVLVRDGCDFQKTQEDCDPIWTRRP